MAQLMLINPRKRKTGGRRKTRSAAQKAATRRLVAFNKSKRSSRSRSVAVRSNPIRRRRSALKAVSRRRSYRRNPISMGGITSSIKDAGIGAVGAIGVDYLYNLLPLPASMKTGLMGTASKVGTALLLGTLGKKVLGQTAAKMAAGSLTVIAYDLIKSYLPVPVPAVAGLGYMSPGINGGYLPQNGMGVGEYTGGGVFDFNSSNSGMGEYITGY